MSAKKPVKVHPMSPTGHLALLPAAIFTLAATLSTEDKEVLAYLISCSGSQQKPYSCSPAKMDHSPRFDCSCFKCYTSFWSRWDGSPNRELIHKIIDAYEERLFKKKSSSKVKKRRKNSKVCDEEQLPESNDAAKLGGGVGDGGDRGGQTKDGSGDGEVGSERGSIMKIVGFVGDRIWGVWNKLS